MSGEEKKAIALRIATARKTAGLTQRQVAGLLGLHRPSVSEIEAGRRNVTGAEIAKMAQIFGVSSSWLTNGKEQDVNDPRVQLAARELAKLKPADLDRVVFLLKTLRRDEDDGTEE